MAETMWLFELFFFHVPSSIILCVGLLSNPLISLSFASEHC